METETLNQLDSYLSFKLGNEYFAANVAKVLEILELTKITKVPKSPSYMRGVINLRGGVLPVIDTRIKFDMEKTEDTVNTCIIVLNVDLDGEQVKVGALVDSVQEVLELDERQIEPPPSIGSKYKSEFIQGLAKVEDDFVMILDLDKVLSTEEIITLKEMEGKTEKEAPSKSKGKKKENEKE